MHLSLFVLKSSKGTLYLRTVLGATLVSWHLSLMTRVELLIQI